MDQTKQDEIDQVMQAYVHEYVAMHQRFLEYTAKYECWDKLSKHDQDFINKIALVIRTYLDERIHQ